MKYQVIQNKTVSKGAEENYNKEIESISTGYTGFKEDPRRNTWHPGIVDMPDECLEELKETGSTVYTITIKQIIQIQE